MKRFFFYAFALALSLSACSKEKETIVQSQQQKQINSSNSNSQNSNSSQPAVNNQPQEEVKTDGEQNLETPKKWLHIKNNAITDPTWSVQYVVANNLAIKKDVDYTITITLKTSEPTTIHFSIGDYHPNNVADDIETSTELTEYTYNFTSVTDGGFVLFQTGNFVGDIWIESIKVTHKGSGKIVALTADEKREVLSNAMDTWIAGMMDATDGYVKAWDVVNEALSGGDGDGDGIYDLQSYKNNNNADPTNVSSGVFYWQVYMGDLEYVRTAVASARKHFKGDPKDLKLFINDYNLESNWDDNGKLKSLIKWIQKWEADGVTKIDGIGTQMHITCYEDDRILNNMKEHIVKMFKLMAGTGKLVRVSELDMGYKRGTDQWSGTNLTTSQLTEKEHQRMADYYQFILEKYFEIVPKKQQYGFCQWCLTDAPGPLGSGWRGGEPVGIWTQNFGKRKAVYKGFAQGLAGSTLSAGVNELNDLKTYIDREKHGDFKFTGAIDVGELNRNQNNIQNILKNNFDEIVAGNAMKYASCVAASGNMNFSRVQQFVQDARALGLSIFGHTLAWHSQQQPAYLLGLMADKEVEVTDESEKIEIVDTYFIYNNLNDYNMWRSSNDESKNINYTIEIITKQ